MTPQHCKSSATGPKPLAVVVPWIVWVITLFATPSSRADQPAVSAIAPIGFQRGQEVSMTLQGERLADTNKLLFYNPGIEVLELTAQEDGKAVTAKLKIADDCQPGLHSLRLASRGGISNVRYFGISAMPIVGEVEPNSEFSAPQSISVNSTVQGLVNTEDVDYYAVELAEDQTLTVELEGLRLGTDFFDPFVAILDADRFELARSDDATLVQQDCVCSMKAPKAGKYIVQVRESSFGGNDRAFYRLHVGDYPRPLAITPSGGLPGETLQATIVDASGETWQETIQLPNTHGLFAYTASRSGKVAPSPNLLRVVGLPNHFETAGDDSDIKTVPVVEPPVAFNGVLEKPGDVDWFKVVGKKDHTMDFLVHARQSLRSPVDSWLEIYNGVGNVLTRNDDNGGKPDSYISFKFPEDGEYFVSIRDQLREGSPLHAYRIEVAPPQPSLNFTIDELQRYTAQLVEVPRGGQMAVILRANRGNFGGPLKLRLDDAPAGIELMTPDVPADQSFIPMMIRASADSAPDASLTSLVGQLINADGTPGFQGSFQQRTQLVFGQNQVDVWGHDAARMALAATEELPFSITVDQPQVPLARLGDMEFIVRATRKEGYAEAIGLRVLYGPGGVSANGAISIPGDQTEARIPVTANHQAQIGTFPITVLANAKGKDAGRWCASPFIQLEIQDSFFDLQFPKAVIAQGESGFVTVAVQAKRPPDGSVEIELLGLPAGATTSTPKVAWSDAAAQVSFPVAVAADARVGQHKTLVAQVTITRPNGSIRQTQGTGELQIVPPPPKPAAEVAATEAQPATAPAAPPTKPLTRLEQLRMAKQK